MDEWKRYILGNIASMKYGKLPPKEQQNGAVPIYSGYRYVGFTDVPNCKKGSIIVVARGVGGSGDVKLIKEDCFLTNLSIAVELNSSVCLPEYFYYRHLLNNLRYLDSGSAQSQITIDDLKRLELSLPSIIEQKRVVSVLKSIDDKIELNNRINHNLEEQAQALYKSWFVDFEPFKDGEFVESELGMIPKGWRVGELSEICEIVGGATPSRAKSEYYTESGIAWLTPKDLSITCRKFTSNGADDITIEGYNSCSAKLMPRGSVLFSSRAPIGYITIAKNEICTNQGFKSAVPTVAGTAFLYQFLKNSIDIIESKASGSTFKEASGSLMKSLPVIIPIKITCDCFEDIMRDILMKQEICEDEVLRLETMRDNILPKLMSGELNIN